MSREKEKEILLFPEKTDFPVRTFAKKRGDAYIEGSIETETAP